MGLTQARVGILGGQGVEKERWATSHGWYPVDRFGWIPVRGGAEKNVLCSDWEREYVQGQSWTMVVLFDHFSKFKYSCSWQHGGCGRELLLREGESTISSPRQPNIFSVVVAKLAFKSNGAGGS